MAEARRSQEDLIVCKTGYSAFIQGPSPIEDELRKRGITAVWVGGTSTNTCCESTARDAMLLDFRTTMISPRQWAMVGTGPDHPPDRAGGALSQDEITREKQRKLHFVGHGFDVAAIGGIDEQLRRVSPEGAFLDVLRLP